MSARESFRLHVMTALFLWGDILFGQSFHISEFEKKDFNDRERIVSSSASNWFDVSYYKLNLTISSQPEYLQGRVTVAGICTQNNSQTLSLDLADAMHVDSIFVNGVQNTFTQWNSSLDIALGRPYKNGEVIAVDIMYQGTPVPTGFGSFIFNRHNGVPWIFSLSEPYGASDWWPCKNSPDDKADSADIIITCDSPYKPGSQGILLSTINNGDGTSTYHWQERYPIASYLISVALTDYVQFSNWFKYSTSDSMEVLNYVLPEHDSIARLSLSKVTDMLSIFSNIFGLYPFIKEKYGHAEFIGGGMEHQTMTSLGEFDEDVVAHELAHQWFGDMITCRTWSDLWLNEGFAQYSTGLYFEKQYGADSYRSYIGGMMERSLNAEGIMGSPDLTNAQTLFNFSLIYAKGATVLHMLRHVLGDSVFFNAIHAYATNPMLQYSTASTKDFQTVCENISNKNLEYFFREWVYGENCPTYEYSWKWNNAGGSSTLTITVKQPEGRSNPAFFTMPIDFRISTATGDTTITVFNDAVEQAFKINIQTLPSNVLLDPDDWILKKVFTDAGIPAEYRLEQNYPNPFNSTTTITYFLPHTEQVTLTVYDLLGREVETLVHARQLPGVYDVPWSSQHISSGVYFYRLIAGDVHLRKKMVVIR